MPFNSFPYLAQALESHWRRFPSLTTGLSEIEEKIVELIQSGIHYERKLVGQLLRWQTFHGFGDLQYFNILDRLKPILDDSAGLRLKPNYKELISNGVINRDYWLGGAKACDWSFDPKEKMLTKN